MKFRIIAILLFLLTGCDQQGEILEREGEPAVVFLDGNNDAMNQAISDARSSIDGLIQQLPRLREQGEYFAVKVPLDTEDAPEHIWVGYPDYKDGVLYGAIGNEPLSKRHKLGDPISTPVSNITDWMVVREGKLYGGFTILVARAKMSPEQKTRFDQSVEFEIPLVPNRL